MRNAAALAAIPYKAGLLELMSIVSNAENEVLREADHSRLISDNINFFAKSFLISICAHLEMCIKDIVYELAADVDRRLSAAAIPFAAIDWRYNTKKKGEAISGKPSQFSISMSRREVDDLVSGNVHKTKDALSIVGVDLAADKAKWESWKEEIQNIVTRRNNIVHHNDQASDLSFGDIRIYITSVCSYIDFIVSACTSFRE